MKLNCYKYIHKLRYLRKEYLALVVGGLLSAHLMSHKMGMQLEPGWPCSGPLLRLAENVARKLLPGIIKRRFSCKN